MFHSFARLRFDPLQLLGGSNPLFEDPLAELCQAVESVLPFQALFGLIAFVAAGGGMSLGLGQLDDVDDGRDVLAAGGAHRLLVGLE
jgi:hypothetical protein